MRGWDPTMLGFVGGLGVGGALAFAVTAGGGGLTPLLVFPLFGAFVGGAIGMLAPRRRH
jgi:hypothetical protein